jgi:predicted HAD superfamily Cof-like phosphohydrolase
VTQFETVIKWIETFDADHKPDLWLSLINEEYRELQEAIAEGDEIAIADAMADLQWVMHGYSYSLRHDADAIFAEVERSNNSKLGLDGLPIRREDGKIMKGPNYSAPQLEPFVIAARASRARDGRLV